MSTNGNNTVVAVENNPLATYTYDANGNIVQIEYGNGDKLLYSYDNAGRVQAISSFVSNTTTQLYQFVYDNNGDLDIIYDFGANTRTEFTYADGDHIQYTVYNAATNAQLHSVQYYTPEDDEQHADVFYEGVWGSLDIEDCGSSINFETGETTCESRLYCDSCEIVSRLVYDYFGRKTGSVTESEPYE